MPRLRISAISYLNTAPLMWDFERGEGSARLREQFEIAYTVPSACAEALRSGAADIGIIPAFAYATIPGLAILPEVAIAARGPVRSILLISKVPKEEIHTVALDTSSRSSAALTQVLFRRWGVADCKFVRANPDLPAMLAQADAGLLIGDLALQVNREGYFVYDLAEEWIKLTGKPFVFAFWTVRTAALDLIPNQDQGPPPLDLPKIFRQSRDHGLEPASMDIIAQEWAPKLAITESVIHTYLTENIHYKLNPDCCAGLELFYREAVEIGLLKVAPGLRLLADAPVFNG